MKQEILEQLNIAWQLFEYHCNELEDTEAMWCGTPKGLRIRKTENTWTADWPETEAYTIGPPSIAWTMWHILYWWRTAITASKEKHIPEKEEIKWPGSVAAAVCEIRDCHDAWVSFLKSLDENELRSGELCRWPFEGKSMYSLALWVNMEFMKNAAEIGAGRFLYAAADAKAAEQLKES